MLKEIFHDSFENFGPVHWQYRRKVVYTSLFVLFIGGSFKRGV